MVRQWAVSGEGVACKADVDVAATFAPAGWFACLRSIRGNRADQRSHAKWPLPAVRVR